jgi:DNA-binding PadR family transcriptional regulator
MEPLTESYFYILLCLYEGENHGYGIMQRTIELSEKRVKIGSGTMYGAISNMIKKGWIVECATTNSRKRMYELTNLGTEIMQGECKRLQELVGNIQRIMGE